MAVNLAKLRGLSIEELRKAESSKREEIWKLRLQITTGQLQDPQKVRAAKKDLARLMTIIREQELAADGGRR